MHITFFVTCRQVTTVIKIEHRDDNDMFYQPVFKQEIWANAHEMHQSL